MPDRESTRPRIVFVGAGPIQTFATSYRCLGLAQCMVEDFGADAHLIVAANDEDQRTFGREYRGVHLHYVPDWPILLTGWRFDPQLFVRTLTRASRRVRLVHRLRPDVVHVFKPLPETLLAGAMLKLLGHRVVLDEDDADADMMAANGHAADGWRYALTRGLERTSHRLCHHVTVASRALEALYRRRRAPVTYIPNGIFADEFAARVVAAKRPRGNVTALYLGALERCFDADIAIDAFGAAHGLVPVLRLLVVGHGSMRRELEARVAALGCADAVEFVGRVPKREVIDWLNRADAFLFPMRRNWINRCRCPLKLREFAAMGRPLVAPAFGEVLEAAPDESVLVHPDATAEDYGAKLAEVAQGLLDGTWPLAEAHDPERFDWHGLAQRLAGVYASLGVQRL